MGYYSGVNSEDLIGSPDFGRIFGEEIILDHEPTEEDLINNNIFILDNAYLKNYEMNINGEKVVVTWRMYVDPIVGGGYKIKTRGVEVETSIDNFIESVGVGYGYELDRYSHSSIIEQVEDEYVGDDVNIDSGIVRGIINLYGKSCYDYRLLDIVYNWLETKTIINNPYITNRTTSEEGTQYVEVGYDDLFLNNIVSYNNETGTLYPYGVTPQLSPKQLDNVIKELYDNDEELRNLFNTSHAIRFMVKRPYAGDDLQVYICGYEFLNGQYQANNVVDGNQSYGCVVKHVKSISYYTDPSQLDYPSLVKQGYSDVDVNNLSITLYNYNRSSWANAYGFEYQTTGGGVVNMYSIIDSINNSSYSNPIIPISDVHSKWYNDSPSEIYVPSGIKPTDGTEPTIENQNLIRGGVTPPVIKPRPVIGTIPKLPTPYPQPPTRTDIIPTGVPSGIHIYELKEEGAIHQLVDLSTFLWNRDNWEELKNIYNNNPLECIISLHQLPCKDEISIPNAPQKIYLGYVDAETNGYVCPNRYIKMSMGWININRKFNDYRDYKREFTIYIPYIGFRNIKAEDVTCYGNYNGGFAKVYLDYIMDIATGDFVAEICINKEQNDEKLLYQYNGNMANILPLTATDKSRLHQAQTNLLINGTASVIGGVADLMTGNVGGAFNQIGNAVGSFLNKSASDNISIQRSGNLSCNYGAMCQKRPFIIINNPIPYDTNYSNFSGDSANATVKVSSLSGFTRFRKVHVDSMNNITDYEKSEIEKILLNGVIL